MPDTFGAGDMKESFDKKSFSFLVSGLILGSVVVFLSLNAGTVGSEEAAQDLVSTLEQSSGQDLEVVNVEESNGLYKVEVKDGNNQLSTYYMTRDGEMIAQDTAMTNFPEFRQQVSAQTNFSSCLEDEGVVMFGNRSQRSTATQIQILGGLNMVSGIYADVNNEQILNQAQQIGIQRIPAFATNESAVQGVQTVPQLEEFSGCEYNG
ncbi:MAG: hypothetical protein BRC29_02165 [Nanohaloarchaea archaeon SW_7_43_1]|nr:MAG: hypothetical protein BRC29_02165 [Nanohaloarchaea archaeon SW_7_43_1]